MRFGVVIPNQGATVAGVAEQLARLEALGCHSAWMPGIPNGPDPLTLFAASAHATSRIEIGPAVIPIHLRHPVALATQALTTNQALRGRLTLGIGVSHRRIIEGLLGVPYESPARYMREYVEILAPLLQRKAVDSAGSVLRARYRLDEGAFSERSPSLVIAALGEHMLRVAGRLADGVVTWMIGLRTLEQHTLPTLREAARLAGRPSPRVLFGIPALLTADRAAGVARANEEFAVYWKLEAYASMLKREGASPGEISLIGDERELARGVERVRALGVSDLQVTPLGAPAECARTVELLAGLIEE